MKREILDTIVENLLYLLPIIHKKILKIDTPDIIQDIHFSHLHLGIMEILRHEALPISEIAKKFLIPKPQMTILIYQLVSTGVVERQKNKADRRMTVIALTEKGKTTLRQIEKNLRRNIKKMLSDLNQEEQAELSVSLHNLRVIGSKSEER